MGHYKVLQHIHVLFVLFLDGTKPDNNFEIVTLTNLQIPLAYPKLSMKLLKMIMYHPENRNIHERQHFTTCLKVALKHRYIILYIHYLNLLKLT